MSRGLISQVRFGFYPYRLSSQSGFTAPYGSTGTGMSYVAAAVFVLVFVFIVVAVAAKILGLDLIGLLRREK